MKPTDVAAALSEIHEHLDSSPATIRNMNRTIKWGELMAVLGVSPALMEELLPGLRLAGVQCAAVFWVVGRVGRR